MRRGRGSTAASVVVALTAARGVGCAGRTGLDDFAHTHPSAGGATSSSTGSMQTDPCGFAAGAHVLGSVPDYTVVRELAVSDGIVTFIGTTAATNEDDAYVYAIPTCGGALTHVAGQPPQWITSHAADAMGVDYAMAGVLRHVDASGVDALVAPLSAEEHGLVLDGGQLYLFERSAGAILRVEPSGLQTILGSAGPLGRSSNIAVGANRVVWIASANAVPFGPLFSVPTGGGALTMGPTEPVPRQIVIVGDSIVAAYASSDATSPELGNIERIAMDGTRTVLATHQFVPTGLTITQGHALWEADGVVRAVPLGGGAVIDVYGHSFGNTDPSNYIIADELAADDAAFYWMNGNDLVRVPLSLQPGSPG